MDIKQRFDGLWNVWCLHHIPESTSAWHVVHVAPSRWKGIQWIKKNGKDPKWYTYQN